MAELRLLPFPAEALGPKIALKMGEILSQTQKIYKFALRLGGDMPTSDFKESSTNQFITEAKDFIAAEIEATEAK